ncbi:MAG: energy-coupling factor transporter transmembrane component T family protein [Candidatus Izemoplasmatales bacterium]|jgi:energy-coupling factor transport system permease protein
MKNIVIGQYLPGSGFFYKLDPRTKIIGVIVLMIAIFLLETILQLAIAFAIGIVLMLVGRLSVKRIARGMRPLFVLLMFTFFFQIFFNREGTLYLEETMTVSLSSIGGIILLTVIWRLLASFKRFRALLLIAYLVGVYYAFSLLTYGYVFTTFTFSVYQRGVEMSIFVVIRLLVIITLSTILTLTTKPTDLTQGLESLMRPLKAIGIRSEDFALIISISLRYIPTILDEANKIMAAQASRGADFQQGKLKDKIRQVISLLVPMFIIAFKRSEDLADAMETRGFVPGMKRTRIHELAFGLTDVFASLFIILSLTASIVLRVI